MVLLQLSQAAEEVRLKVEQEKERRDKSKLEEEEETAKRLVEEEAVRALIRKKLQDCIG